MRLNRLCVGALLLTSFYNRQALVYCWDCLNRFCVGALLLTCLLTLQNWRQHGLNRLCVGALLLTFQMLRLLSERNTVSIASVSAHFF